MQELRKQGLTLSDLRSSLGSYNYIKKLSTNEDKIELFTVKSGHLPEPEKLIDVAIQLAHLFLYQSSIVVVLLL